MTVVTTSPIPGLVNEGDSVRACVQYDTLPSTEVTVVLQSRSGGTGGAQGMKLTC